MNGYNFTDRVRMVLKMSRDEAVRLRHEQVDTEHLLFAMIRESEGIACAVLQQALQTSDLSVLRQRIENAVTPGRKRMPADDLPYTRAAKKVLELAMTEARELNHAYVGTEHLLLGLLREGKGIAAEVLSDLGVTLEGARAETLRLLASEMPAGPPEQGRRAEILARMRTLVGELLAAPAPDASRLAAVAAELNGLLDELAGSHVVKDATGESRSQGTAGEGSR